MLFHPLTPERWDDFTALFGPHGAYDGCWCMFWHLPHKEFHQNCGEKNKTAMRALVKSGMIPGIIGYRRDRPEVWCAIAPREDFSALERSRSLKRMDDRSVWSIVCFYIAKSARKAGLMVTAIRAAVEYAHRNGAKIVKAYPLDIQNHCPPGELYMGNLSTFLKAGFKEMETRGTHKIVRYEI